jgi:sugar-phosphatase
VNPADVIEFAHGRPSRDTVARFAAEPARVKEWDHWIHTAEGERFTEVTTIPGAIDTVRALPSGLWAVVTSAIHDPAVDRLAQNGFPTPAVLIGADDVRRGKPHPEGYLAAASALGVDASDCVVFEDTSAGIEAGLAAGCTVVAIGDVEATGIAGRLSDFTSVSIESLAGRIRLTFP